MKSLSILSPGQKVTVAVGIEAFVRCARIGPGTEIAYLVAWWHDGGIREEWIPSNEFPLENFVEAHTNGRYLGVSLS